MNETRDTAGTDGVGMIQMNHVGKWYGDFQVLSNCTTKVDKGEVVVVCGPSGSGKSTLIKVINGLEPFQEGAITFNGISVGDRTTNLPKLRAQIGMVFQNFELFPHLSIIENIKLAQTDWGTRRAICVIAPESANAMRAMPMSTPLAINSVAVNPPAIAIAATIFIGWTGMGRR